MKKVKISSINNLPSLTNLGLSITGDLVKMPGLGVLRPEPLYAGLNGWIKIFSSSSQNNVWVFQISGGVYQNQVASSWLLSINSASPKNVRLKNICGDPSYQSSMTFKYIIDGDLIEVWMTAPHNAYISAIMCLTANYIPTSININPPVNAITLTY